MFTKEKADELLNDANTEYRRGNFELAEQMLVRASKLKALSQLKREQIFDRLTGLACEQGLFNSAAFWYSKVVQSKSRRLTLSASEMKSAIRNYRVLLTLSLTSDDNSRRKLTA